MKKILNPTKDSPSITFESGRISITGLSFPEKPDFYDETTLIIKKVMEENKVEKIDIQLSFTNPLTKKFIVNILDLFKDKKELAINWLFEDNFSLEEGKEFEELFLGRTFTFIEKKQEGKTFS